MAGFDFTKIGGSKELDFAEKGMNLAFHLQGDLYSKAWFGDNSEKRPETQAFFDEALTKNIFPEIST
jgi:hypothetical protein